MMGSSTRNYIERPGASKMNVNAAPFCPSYLRASDGTKISQNETVTKAGNKSTMSYRDAVQVAKPITKTPKTTLAAPADTMESTSLGSTPVTVQGLTKMSLKPKPTDPIPLAEFFSLNLMEPEKRPHHQPAPVASTTSRVRMNHGPMVGPTVKKEPRRDEKTTTSTSNLPRGNILDSTAPVLHRGKQRENPKKKYTRIKKVILNERKQRKENQIIPEETPADEAKDQIECENTVIGNEDEVEQNAEINSEGNTEDPPAVETSIRSSTKVPKRSKFCNNVLSKELDEGVTKVIQELRRFQDRLYAKDPEKARLKKRLVYGLREVHKLLKVEKVKCVILAPNIEPASGEGGLDQLLDDITSMCREQNVPFIFALSKHKLGYIGHKHNPVSCVGMLNYQGADEFYKSMMELVVKSKQDFLSISESK